MSQENPTPDNGGPTSPNGAPTPGAPVPPPMPGQQPAQPPLPQQPGAQQPYYGAPQPPYQGYPVQPPYPAAPEPPKKAVWPWVLGGCLGSFLLVCVAFVGCVSCALYASVATDEGRDGGYGYSDSFDPYDYHGFNGSGNDGGNRTYNGSDSRLTYDDIVDAAGDLPNNNIDGKCTSGVYRVGIGKDIEPGRYFFEGSVDEEGSFTVFESDGKQDRYAIDTAVVYFGNYFTDLEEGDLVVFMGAEGDRMYRADEADFKPAAPYECGLFRVGTDIPAGTYAVTVQDEAAAAASSESAAFVMKDLDFDDDSITDTKYVAKGGTQTITVKDGDWLELYAATAAPTE